MTLKRPEHFSRKINDAICKYGDYQFTVDRYRRRSNYVLSHVTRDAYTLRTPSKMPSEPDHGVKYTFGATGYDILKNKTITANGGLRENQTKVCDYKNIAFIPTGWKNIQNYYHWMISELPYLALAYSSVQSFNTQLIIVPDHILAANSPFAFSTHDALQVHFKTDVPIISISEAKNISAENFYLPYNNCSYSGDLKVQNAHYSWYHSSRATAYALSCFKTLFPALKASTGKQIYINRTTRILKNEAKVKERLMQMGFECISLETLSVREQANLFQNADIVVGMHGAGLTNLGFCSKGTHVIEFADPAEVAPLYKEGIWVPGSKATRTHYHLICATLGLNYDCLWVPNKTLELGVLDQALENYRKNYANSAEPI